MLFIGWLVGLSVGVTAEKVMGEFYAFLRQYGCHSPWNVIQFNTNIL